MAKTTVSFAQFFYRDNPDNTIDAICGYCFLTVATANTRTELRSPLRKFVEQTDWVQSARLR
jgi:hypothetical protein